MMNRLTYSSNIAGGRLGPILLASAIGTLAACGTEAGNGAPDGGEPQGEPDTTAMAVRTDSGDFLGRPAPDTIVPAMTDLSEDERARRTASARELLVALATAQDDHRAETGGWALTPEELGIEVPSGLSVGITRGQTSWRGTVTVPNTDIRCTLSARPMQEGEPGWSETDIRCE